MTVNAMIRKEHFRYIFWISVVLAAFTTLFAKEIYSAFPVSEDPVIAPDTGVGTTGSTGPDGTEE